MSGWSEISDSHVVWDRVSQRWYLTTIVQGGPGYGVQIMVSTDATGTTFNTSVPVTFATLMDNPQPTVTSDKLVIGSNATDCLWAVDIFSRGGDYHSAAQDPVDGSTWMIGEWGGNGMQAMNPGNPESGSQACSVVHVTAQ